MINYCGYNVELECSVYTAVEELSYCVIVEKRLFRGNERMTFQARLKEEFIIVLVFLGGGKINRQKQTFLFVYRSNNKYVN